MIRVDPAGRRAWKDGTEIDLTVKEFDVLNLLTVQPGAVVSRKTLFRKVWDTDWGPTKTLDMHMAWLRRKLGDDPAKWRIITTVRGVGYRFDGECERTDAPAGPRGPQYCYCRDTGCPFTDAYAVADPSDAVALAQAAQVHADKTGHHVRLVTIAEQIIRPAPEAAAA